MKGCDFDMLYEILIVFQEEDCDFDMLYEILIVFQEEDCDRVP